MASLMSEGPGCPASLPGIISHGSSGHNLGPAAWSRSLERALDEAAGSGVLNLNGRKLKEFPRGARDLSDTTGADLSRNRLAEIPAEVCHYVSLESLNLYQNCIRNIPEAILNLQALAFLNISRNQLTTLPAHLCNLPLKVLIASNNKLISLPEEIGRLRHLTELDVSCNEIQRMPPQVGSLESLRDLNVRRNHLEHLPEELAELPLVRIDCSCNKISSIPVCYRNLRHLQMIALENNPLQSPPAQICIKGKIHIFKYLNMEACKTAPELPDYDRRPLGYGSCPEELYTSRPYGALDSGFNSVDSGDKRWSGNEPTDEFSDLPQRIAEAAKEQRLRREGQYLDSRGSTHLTNGAVEHDLEQIDYIDSCATEEDDDDDSRLSKGDSLSSKFMAYIERRQTSHEGSPVKPTPIRECQRTDETRRYSYQSRDTDELRRPETLSLSQDREKLQSTRSHPDRTERTHVDSSYLLSMAHYSNQNELEFQRRREQLVERTRREAQLAALQYEEERIRNKHVQREAVLDFVKHKATLSPQKQSPLDSENGFEPHFVFEIDSDTNTIKRRPGMHTQPLSGLKKEECVSNVPGASAFRPDQSDDRSTISPVSPTSQTVHLSPPYPGSATPSSYRSPTQRPESFLFRAAVREEGRRAGHTPPPSIPVVPSDPIDSQKQEEDLELTDQLRKNIELRLKVSLPSDLGAALTDGVVLCHLANHVRPRSVPSIHVPSPAVPKLTMAKCRRNVENFLEACRKIGVPQESLCCASDILQLNLFSIKRTVETLLTFGADSHMCILSMHLLGFGVFYCTVLLALSVFYHWIFSFWPKKAG
ncbi:DISP complex protein LRCH3 isoform X2 [Ambystoma mexicanum]|uniref:DISP complex protein LRCH3 isoform X2 n=1 Tax=Ambystoma mexicanum TaxID=8296 RepID=UPI0037E823C2